jgi:hypothetical protein
VKLRFLVERPGRLEEATMSEAKRRRILGVHLVSIERPRCPFWCLTRHSLTLTHDMRSL